MSFLPDDIRIRAEETIGRITDVRPVGGGCINNGARIISDKGSFFVKWNRKDRFPGMFEAEASGLAYLAKPKAIRIPEVISVLHGTTHAGILLEFIETRRTTDMAGMRLGEQLAELHQHTSESFGLDQDNYMGSLVQHNSWNTDLVAFFTTCRLEPQFELAFDDGRLPARFRRDAEDLYDRLPDLLVWEKPALIHGDLWSGNYLVDADENPVLIDPAVSFGHREMDIAMTRLFGGFPDSFYRTYQETYPLAEGFEDRLEIYNLYPLLIHVNLFGGGYAAQVMSSVSRILRQS